MNDQTGLNWNETEHQVYSIQQTRNILTGVVGSQNNGVSKPLELRLFVTSLDGKKTFLCKVKKVLGFCAPKTDDTYVGIFASAIRVVDATDTILKEMNNE